MGKELQDFSLDYFSIAGKTAVITGGNTGLGRAYTVALAAAGANVFIVTHGTNWEETKEALADKVSKAIFYQADLSDRHQVKQVIPACHEAFGAVDILINNAGTIRRNPLLEYQEKDWDDVLALNLDALYLLSQAAAVEMVKQQSGKIINIASMLSFQGGKFIPPYTASKHAVAGLTKSFANELAGNGIQVNAIAPGYFATKNTAPIRENEQRNAEILARIPAGEWGDPSELMGTVVYLASKASDYMNGHVLVVDGGWLAR
ncbi:MULTISPECIES: 2-dehydro-3-deoxy-D-gluconate 5-dehydrogenase KduD [Gracilibacillus]|uniref:2-dehydro-3-deoxy-D-gluconate 5-dehydrogenase KduD n=1 Tax=Gracilibacillus TaxID=74385 RepID=UPI00082559EB|nr:MULTISPECIES: 2-dehydro-3-deoxy-D-gluconate 5-dehydrogenase KduD [Gracilibacillus]